MMYAIVSGFLCALLAVVNTTPEPAVRPGEPPLGRVLLPNQWFLDPAGDHRPLGDFPMNMQLSPDGKYLAVLHCGAGDHEVIVFETGEMERLSRTLLPNAYYGIVFSRDGSRLYISGGESEVIHIFQFTGGYLFAPESIRLAPENDRRVPCGIDLSPNGRRLIVCETWGNAVCLVDL